jgi:hypothetical protein
MVRSFPVFAPFMVTSMIGRPWKLPISLPWLSLYTKRFSAENGRMNCRRRLNSRSVMGFWATASS